MYAQIERAVKPLASRHYTAEHEGEPELAPA
jgi:hypothetical protein